MSKSGVDSFINTKKCYQCGKDIFITDVTQWAYKIERKYFCSWHCIQEYRKNIVDKRGNPLSPYPIIEVDTEGNEIGRYKSVREASEQLGLSTQSIHKVVRGERGSTFGHIFRRLD